MSRKGSGDKGSGNLRMRRVKKKVCSFCID